MIFLLPVIKKSLMHTIVSDEQLSRVVIKTKVQN